MGVKGGTYYCDKCGVTENQKPAALLTGSYGTFCIDTCLPEDVRESFREDRERRKAEGGGVKVVQAVLDIEDIEEPKGLAAPRNPVSSPRGPSLDERHEEATEYATNYTGGFEFMLKMRQWVEGGRFLTHRQAEAVLRCKANDERRAQKVEREKEMAEVQATVTEGMYRKADGTIYKVQRAVHGSGNLYAKRLSPPDEFGGKAKFEYAPGAIRRLSIDERMTLEEAKEWGALYGTCCVCGRTLTNEESIEAGIGPVCSGRV